MLTDWSMSDMMAGVGIRVLQIHILGSEGWLLVLGFW